MKLEKGDILIDNRGNKYTYLYDLCNDYVRLEKEDGERIDAIKGKYVYPYRDIRCDKLGDEHPLLKSLSLAGFTVEEKYPSEYSLGFCHIRFGVNYTLESGDKIYTKVFENWKEVLNEIVFISHCRKNLGGGCL